METGILYIVATPIGNLDDITLRAIKTLQEADLIAAEDTRHTLKLLNHLEISKPMISYHRHNEETKSNVLIEKLQEGQNIALVSDAGTPGICDPGEEVIKKCIELGIKIVPIPGACAMINSLICSGIDTKEFTFLGFLTLKDLQKILNEERKITLAREITKIHEEFIRGNIDEIIQKSENLKGEIVLIIEGNKESEEENSLNNLTIEEHYKFYENQGFSKKDIIKKVAKDRNMNKNEVYQKFI